jgi:hypothetical protein
VGRLFCSLLLKRQGRMLIHLAQLACCCKATLKQTVVVMARTEQANRVPSRPEPTRARPPRNPCMSHAAMIDTVMLPHEYSVLASTDHTLLFIVNVTNSKH